MLLLPMRSYRAQFVVLKYCVMAFECSIGEYLVELAVCMDSVYSVVLCKHKIDVFYHVNCYGCGVKMALLIAVM